LGIDIRDIYVTFGERCVYTVVSDNYDNMIKLQIEIIKLVNVKFSNWICKLMFSEFEK